MLRISLTGCSKRPTRLRVRFRLHPRDALDCGRCTKGFIIDIFYYLCIGTSCHPSRPIPFHPIPSSLQQQQEQKLSGYCINNILRVKQALPEAERQTAEAILTGSVIDDNAAVENIKAERQLAHQVRYETKQQQQHFMKTIYEFFRSFDFLDRIIEASITSSLIERFLHYITNICFLFTQFCQAESEAAEKVFHPEAMPKGVVERYRSPEVGDCLMKRLYCPNSCLKHMMIHRGCNVIQTICCCAGSSSARSPFNRCSHI